MRYWWVNQNQTFEQELEGGFLWSPKRKANGQCNPFYEFMREVAPGDVIFSFAKTHILAVGVAQSNAFPAPKPAEFGLAGPNWSDIGWKVSIYYRHLATQITPANHMDLLGPVLPQKYSPLQANGHGNQGVYLTRLSTRFADILLSLIGREAKDFVDANLVDDVLTQRKLSAAAEVIAWEDYIADEINKDMSIEDSERKALVLARRGQGKFKRNVQKIETRCRVTGVERPEHLIASHCKPWRDCESYEERLDGENGLLLTPSIDHLFDRGFISFERSGILLVAKRAHSESLKRMGIPVGEKVNVGSFSEGQRSYLEYHREKVFLRAQINE